MNISVCLDAVYSGRDIIESMQEVSSLGIHTIEFWDWWNKDLDRIHQAMNDMDMKVSTFCTRFVSLVDASRHEAYLEGLAESIRAAKFLGVDRLITQVGMDTGEARTVQHRNLVTGLKRCLPILEAEGIVLMIEPLNTLVDHQGYYLYGSKEAFEIIGEVDSPNVKVVFDIYHQQIMEGNLINNITANIDKIGHFHAAGHPGRHELAIGEINYNNVLKAIDAADYVGYVGLEYFPLDDPSVGLEKLSALKPTKGKR